MSVDEIAAALGATKTPEGNLEAKNILTMGKDRIRFFIPGKEMPVSPTEVSHNNGEVRASASEKLSQSTYSAKFLIERLGIDLNTEDGKKIQERMSRLPNELLRGIGDGTELKDLLAANELPMSFDNLSNTLELIYGITLRSEEELKASEPQREMLFTQIKAAELLANLYETVAANYDQYTDNLGVFGLGSEGMAYLINKLGLDGENSYQWADSCREFAQRTRNLKVLNPEKFNEGFKKIYNENGKYGIEFNADSFKKLFAIVNEGKATDENGKLTQEYKDAVLDACNFHVNNPNDDINKQVINGLGEVLIMIMTFGAAAEAQGAKALASATIGRFNRVGARIAAKQVKNKLYKGALRLSGKTATLIGPALNEGTKMATYTLTTGTVANLANRTIKADSEESGRFWETQGAVLEGTAESFGFGAFAGVFGSTVTKAVVERVSKTSSKVVSSLSEKFANGAVSATDVYAKVLEKSIPTTLGECAAFATDVLGFTGYEAAIAIYNNADKNITADNFAQLLWDEFKNQGYSLGQIKLVSHLVMWMSGSRSARLNSGKYLKENLPQLWGTTVEQNGEAYRINLPDGRKIECKNANEMISSLHLMVRGQTAFSSKFDKPETVSETRAQAAESAGVKEPAVQTPEGVEPKEPAVETSEGVKQNEPPAQAPCKKFTTIEEMFVDEHISNDEANAFLRESGLTEQQIADLRNEYKDKFNAYVELLKIIQEQENASLKDVPAEEVIPGIKGLFSMPEWEKAAKSYNERTLQSLCDNLKISRSEAFDLIKKSQKEGSLEIYNEHLSQAFELSDFSGISVLEVCETLSSMHEELRSNLTPERLKAHKMISDALGTEFDLWKACRIEHPERITPEFVQDLKKTADELKKFNITSTVSDDPVKTLADIKAKLSLAQELSRGERFAKDEIEEIIDATRVEALDLARELCCDNELPKDQLVRILRGARKENIDLIRELRSNKEFPRERISDTLRFINKDNINLARVIVKNKGIPYKFYSEILNATIINDPNDAGGNNGKVDPKKVARYTRLLQNPNTSAWTISMLEQGFDMETISRLSPTKQTFHAEPKEAKSSSAKSANPDVQFFMDMGLDTKAAEAIVKGISKSGVVNPELQNSAVNLINSGIAHNKIGDILTLAQITGEYNPKIIEDFIALQGLGLNSMLEKNIAVLNNITGADCVAKINAKPRKQLIGNIENLPDDVKSGLAQRGFDITSILEKLNCKIVQSSPNLQGRVKVQNGFRPKSKITGFEKAVIDKYEPVETVWRSEEASRKWAEDKYQEFKAQEYRSTLPGEHVDVEEINRQRKQGLKEWFDFMESDAEIKDNPFIRVLLVEYITKELRPENPCTPPALDKALVKKILSGAAVSGNIPFKEYTAELKEKARKSSGAVEIVINGKKMTCYTVPKTDSSHPDFKENAAKVRAFSDGTNWCIRTWNAEPYIQQGNIHFLVDEAGLTQVCIREGGPNQIAEIQKRQQAAIVPVAYIEFIQEFIAKKNLRGCESGISSAVSQLPEFNATKERLQEFVKAGNYKAILEEMGIDVKVLEDGSWEISHYSSYLGSICLNDYGIKENDLLANVSVIRGKANFKDSNITTLPNLREVGGELDFGYTPITNLKCLTHIDGKRINW